MHGATARMLPISMTEWVHAMQIDLLGLEAFMNIANCGSFKRAAGHLNLSQAALSHRLKKLEDNLGVALLARTTRHVIVTPAGLELLPVAQKMLQEVSSALDALRERGKSGHERLAIGCLPTLALLYLPSVLAEFATLNGRTPVQIYDNSAAEIAARVQRGRRGFRRVDRVGRQLGFRYHALGERPVRTGLQQGTPARTSTVRSMAGPRRRDR